MKIDIPGTEMASPEPPHKVTEDAPLFTLSTSTTPCLNKMHAHPTLAEQNLLNAVPVIGIAHIYTDKDEDFIMLSDDLVTVFLGPNAQEHCDKFQSDLMEHWNWYEQFTHQTLTEQWDPLLERTFMMFIMAESFDPSIRYVMQRAKLYNVTAVVMTHHPATFPADIVPILHMADGLDFTGSLRAVIGGNIDANIMCTDLGDIRWCIHASRRLVQHMSTVSTTKQLPLAAKQALDHFNLPGTELARANCVFTSMSTGSDAEMDDYWAAIHKANAWTIHEGNVWANEECTTIVGTPWLDGMVRVVITIGWN
jgi:hypothetical protein